MDRFNPRGDELDVFINIRNELRVLNKEDLELPANIRRAEADISHYTAEFEELRGADLRPRSQDSSLAWERQINAR